ncbi:MAG: universal stress protein [Proteobacteria bacterium]|nr:universal stress protein [Pseudomonadota bacterium]
MYKKILLPIDLAHPSSSAKIVENAIMMSQIHKAKLHVLAVVPDFGMSWVGSFFPENFEKEAGKEASRQLHEFVKANIPSDIEIEYDVRMGTVYDEVLLVAKEIEPDLIVMGSHSNNLGDYLMGSNVTRIVRYAKCSTLVIRE